MMTKNCWLVIVFFDMIIHHFFLSNSLGRISSFLLFDGQWMNVTKIFITFFIAIVCRLKRFTLWKISCRKMARVITFSILWLPDIQIHYLLRRHATLWRSTENKDLTRNKRTRKGLKTAIKSFWYPCSNSFPTCGRANFSKHLMKLDIHFGKWYTKRYGQLSVRFWSGVHFSSF